MAVINTHPSNINLTSPQITPSAVLIADTASFYATLDASNNYLPVQVNGLDVGVQLGAGVLPPTLTRVIRTGSNILTPFVISACLELQSTKGGFVLPRMTLAQRNALIATNGMQVYVIDDDIVSIFMGGTWVNFSQGNGDVSGPSESVQNNIATFADDNGKIIQDSGVQINPDSDVLTVATNLAVGNELTSISTLEFVTGSVGANDCAIGLSISPSGAGTYLARLFRTLINGTDDAAAMVFSNRASGVTSSSPNAILEINSIESCFLNARMTTAQMNGMAAPVTGMQVCVTDVSPPALYYYDGTQWSHLEAGGAIPFPFREAGVSPNLSLYMGTGFNTSATGSRNLGISDDALTSLISGSDNVALGSNSFKFLNNSSGNTAIGSLVYSNPANALASNSVFIGGQTGGNLSTVTNVNHGTIIGNCSMSSGSPSTITSSVLLGTISSLSSQLNNCIYIGNGNSGDININAVSSNRVVIGNSTVCNVNNAMVIGGFKGSATYLQVGIGTQNPIAALHVNGSQALGFTRSISSSIDGVITSNYSVQSQWDYCMPVDSSGGPITITLPASAGFGQIFIVKDVGGAAQTNGITINPNGRMIDNFSSIDMTINYASITIYSNGTNYFTIGGSYVPLPPLTLNEVSPGSYPYTAQLSDNVVFVDASSARTINLPNATTTQGKLFFVKDSTGQSQTNNITVQAVGGANIDGSSTYLVDTTYGATAFISDGTQYFSLSTDSTGGGGGGVSSVSGTANRITSSGGSTPVIDISASYVGQTSITTLGTLTSLKVGGSQTVGQTGPVSGTYNVLAADYIVKCDTTAAAVSVVLPDATTNVGQVFYVKDWAGLSGTNNITITTAGGKIDGSTSYVISANYASLTVFSDGSNYYIV